MVERRDFGGDALMNRVGADQSLDRAPIHRFRTRIGVRPLRRLTRRDQQTQHFAPWIGERGAHRVGAIEPRRGVVARPSLSAASFTVLV